MTFADLLSTVVSLFFDMYNSAIELWDVFTTPLIDLLLPFESSLPEWLQLIINSQAVGGLGTILNALQLSNWTILGLMVGSGVTFFLVITVVKWVLDIIF